MYELLIVVDHFLMKELLQDEPFPFENHNKMGHYYL